MQAAYLDPGSGSIIATAVVGGLAGAGVALRSARARVGGVFSRNKGDASESASEVDTEDSESSSPADVDS